MCDFLDTPVQDYFRPFRDSDLLVARRWYPAAPGAPCLPFPSAFCSPHWEPFPWLPRNVGAVYPDVVTYPRLGVIQGFDYEHVCGSAEDFALGAVFDPARNVVYDDEWIPECCGRDSVCVTQLCSQDQEHGRPAAQLRSYPIPHQDATDTTPVVVEHWGLNLGNSTPAWPGFGYDWFAAGEAGAEARQFQTAADNLGNLQFQFDRWAFAGGAAIEEHRTASGYAFDVTDGADAGTLTLGIVGGALELGGANATINPALMPPGWEPWVHQVVTAAGTTQGTAAPITTPSVAILVTSANGSGVRLPLPTEVPTLVSILNVSATHTYKVYPAQGDAWIPSTVVNVPIDLPPQTQLFVRRVATNQWMIESSVPTVTVPPPPPPPMGTVTSVGISTSSSAVTVGVTNPTTTPALTVDLDADLNALAALAGTNTIYYRSGAATWTAVTIGANLTFAGGTLSAAAPGTGTVTSVGISTTSVGLAVGVTNPTTTPALTVNLDLSLNDVVGLAATTGILRGDGAGGIVALTVSDYLNYTAGTLKVVPPSATNGQLVCAAFAITGAAGVYQATGNTFAIAAAGTYLVTGKIRGGLVPSTAGSGRIVAKLRNNTAAAFVANSETTVVWHGVNGNDIRATAGFTAVVTISGATTFELYAMRTGVTFAYSSIESDAEGYTVFDWVKLSN